MEPFTVTQWAVVILVFVLGLFLGGAMFASRKWKRRYRDEAARREELEAENARLHRDAREMETLRGAAARSPARDPHERGPL